MFIVAACNPHRGNSLASLRDESFSSNGEGSPIINKNGSSESFDATWLRGTYNVHSLHPTIKLLIWNYGSLNESQERDYINAKMKMVNMDMDNAGVSFYYSYICTSYNISAKSKQ